MKLHIRILEEFLLRCKRKCHLYLLNKQIELLI